MTHTTSLSARIAHLEDDANDLSYLRETRVNLQDELAACEKRLAAAERAAAVLARMGDIVALAEADVAAPAQEAPAEPSPAGDDGAPAAMPELEESAPVPAPEPEEAPSPPEPPEGEAGPSPEGAAPAESPTQDPAGTADAMPQPEPASVSTGTIREQLLDLIGANPGMMVSDAVSCLPHLNPATVGATLSKMCLRGELKGEGFPKQFTLPQEEAEEPEPTPEPAEPAGAEPEAPDPAVVEPPPVPAQEPTPELPAPPPPTLPKTVIRNHPPQPRRLAEPREVSLPRDLPPLPQAHLKATPVEVELVCAALKNHGRPMSKSLILNRVIKSGIKSGALEDALAQLVVAHQVQFTGSGQYMFAPREAV